MDDAALREFVGRNIGLIELLGLLAILIGWGIWELRKTDRALKASREKQEDDEN